MWSKTFFNALDKYKAFQKSKQEMESYKRLPGIIRLFKKRPKMITEEVVNTLCNKYVNEFREAHDLPSEITIKWQSWNVKDAEAIFPVLSFKTYQHNCYFVTRLAFQDDGSTIEWGCPYPLAECGLTGRTYEYGIHDDILNAKYNQFDELITEIRKTIAPLYDSEA